MPPLNRTRTSAAVLLAVALLLSVASCRPVVRAMLDRPPPGGGPAPVITDQLLPTQVIPGAGGPDVANLAVVGPATAWNGLLFVFLPGTGGQPACCRDLLQTAAQLGYHAIGLTYDNQTAVGARCLNDLACYGQVRRNVFDGSDPGPASTVPPRDGIDNRLVALLGFLARRYPAEGWARFLRGGRVDYRLVVLGGHSQGGGEAAFIGALQALAGEVTLSSPPDTDSSHQPADWVRAVQTGRTPVSRIYAFVHYGDPFYPRIVADWAAMGLGAFGGPALVDTTAAPYGGAHELVSAAPLPAVLLATHDSTAVDSATPICPDGNPEYAPVWRAMLQEAGGLPVTTAPPGCSS